jgi:hypothetical protein
MSISLKRSSVSLRKVRLDIIDAVCHWCAENNIDVETAAALIKKDAVLRAKIQIEAENLNILKPSARLPIDV